MSTRRARGLELKTRTEELIFSPLLAAYGCAHGGAHSRPKQAAPESPCRHRAYARSVDPRVDTDGKIPVTESHSGGVALTAKDRAVLQMKLRDYLSFHAFCTSRPRHASLASRVSKGRTAVPPSAIIASVG